MSLLPTPDLSSLEKIRAELSQYEHPLFDFIAELAPNGVQVEIRLKSENSCEPYTFLITDRDLADTRYGWRFQHLLFNYLHDYVVELFIRTPQRQ
ncbi:MAG: hypothetical protein HY774_01140 [Acidobacteria bacterium]|nr:hypothetical protein [Acidobacteriota bacterium]